MHISEQDVAAQAKKITYFGGKKLKNGKNIFSKMLI